jgi:hypothetical protein
MADVSDFNVVLGYRPDRSEVFLCSIGITAFEEIRHEDDPDGL